MTQDKILNNPMNIKYNSRAVFTDPYDEYIFKLLVKLFAFKKKTSKSHKIAEMSSSFSTVL